MKTIMQTLISKLQTEISELNKKIDKYQDSPGVYIGHKYGLDHALAIAESLLELEKEQKEKDFVSGYKKRAELSNLIFDEASELTAKELFNETF